MIGKGIKRVIKKNAVKLEILTDGQEDGSYDSGGNFVKGSRVPEFIQLFQLPLTGTEAQNLPENLRTKTVLNYWTVESSKIEVKKKIVIDEDIYSIETAKLYTSHTEGVMSRTGKHAHKKAV